LFGWRLPSSSARIYEPIVPQQGMFSSRVLGLDVAMEVDRLRFYYGGAPVPESEDLIVRLESMVGGLVERRETAEQERERAEQERERAEQERDHAEQERERAEQERDEALRKLALLEEELAKLRG
jgi:chromosome segregation ATPase